MERLRQRAGEPHLLIHPQDAVARDIGDGDVVQVRNELGGVTLPARVSDDLVPGTVLAPSTWWAKHSPDGRNINRVTAQDEADMGAGAIFFDAVVWVGKVTG